MILGADGREANGNGVSLTERQMRKQMQMNATIGDVNEIAGEHAKRAMNHLGNQIPPFVEKMVHDAINGFYQSLLERGMLMEPRDAVPPPRLPTVEESERAKIVEAVHGQNSANFAPPTDSEGDE